MRQSKVVPDDGTTNVATVQAPPYVRQSPTWLQRLRAWLVLLYLVSPFGLGWYLPQVPGNRHRLLSRAELSRNSDKIRSAFLFAIALATLPSLLFGEGQGQFYLPMFLAGCAVYLVVDERRWGALAWILTLFLLVHPILTIVVVVSQTCDKVQGHITTGFYLQTACQRATIAQPDYHAWSPERFQSLLWGNFIVLTTQRINFRTHFKMVLLEFALEAVSAVAVLGRGDNWATFLEYPIVRYLWHTMLAMSFILWLFEREIVFHFLASVEKDNQVSQEKLLVALLGHEIKNPLTVVKFTMHKFLGPDSVLEQLLASAAEPRPNQQLVSEDAMMRLLPDAIQGTAILAEIVENCRHLAKFESGTYEQQRDVVNLHELAKSCLAMYSRERERALGLELNLECPADLVIITDRRLWQHALMNLIRNAVKTTMHEDPLPARSRVTLRIESVPDGRLSVEVMDTGVVSSFLNHGDSFETRRWATQQLGSSGLGLHLSAQIVHMLHGRLEARGPMSDDGRGTVFYFTVPIMMVVGGASSATAHAVAAAPEPRMRSSALRRMRVLVVEDDELNALVMQMFFEQGMRARCGWHVTVHRVPTAEAALRVMGNGTKCPFDMLVIDQHMEPSGGVLKGTDLVREVQGRQYEPQPPLMAMASVLAEDVFAAAKFRDLGAKIVWSKPYPPDAQLVSDILDNAHHMFPDINAVDVAPLPVPASICTARDASRPPGFDWQQSLKVLKRVLWAWTELPDVPGEEFRKERLRLVSQRDLTFVHMTTLVQVSVQCIIHIFWPLTKDLTRAWQVFGLIRFLQVYLIWNPKRWLLLVYANLLGFTLLTIQLLYLVVENVCDDPEHLAHHDSDTSFCEPNAAGDPDVAYSNHIYMSNLWIFYFGGITIKLQLKFFSLQLLLITVAYVVSTARNNQSDLKIATFCANSLQLVWMLIILERNWRMHYLETRAKEALVEQQKTLVALLCNEMKKPLQVIGEFLDELVQRSYDPSKIELGSSAESMIKKLLPGAIKGTTMLVDIVENCHHLAKFESGTYKQQRDVVNVHELAKSCLAMHSRERDAGLKLHLECPEDLVIISDRRLWQHALMNLIGNAVKFTMLEKPAPVGTPRVTVRITRTSEAHLRVEVTDTGPGIKSGDQEVVFKVFAQACRGFAAQGLGSGLGLHLSAQIIRMLRGELELASPLVDGRGTSFHFDLPFVEYEAPVTPKAGSMRDLRILPPEFKILIIEDDDLNVLVMQTSLEIGLKDYCGTTARVTRTRTAEEALLLIGYGEVCPFDMLVIDEHMEPAGGVMKGTRLVNIMAGREILGRRPILAIASCTSDDLTEYARYRESGANIVWTKPYPGMALMVSDIVGCWLDHSPSNTNDDDSTLMWGDL